MVIIYNFEWDEEKPGSNQRKHGIGFEEAATVFRAPNSITILDPDHSEDEERWVTMGVSETGRLPIVCHTFHEAGADSVMIRIFSSRKANKQETTRYGERS